MRFFKNVEIIPLTNKNDDGGFSIQTHYSTFDIQQTSHNSSRK